MRVIYKSMTILILFLSQAFPFTDQTTTERIIKENKDFINFMNVSITNFGDQERTNLFKELYLIHFNAFVSYLQSDYKNAYKKLYDSQERQSLLYSYIVKKLYLDSSKEILDSLAPIIIKSKNTRARKYLSLGYRDRTVGRNNFVFGEASNPRLHSNKIYKYIKAIKRVRRAKRYGFLALWECQSDEMKKEIYNHLITKEKGAGNHFFNRFLIQGDDEFLQEINKTYKEHKESIENKKETQTQGIDQKETPMKGSIITAESRIEKRVRFRQEKTTANYLLNYEFDGVDDMTRKYIKDYNFKLIQATFEVLATHKGDSKDEIDYNSFKIHHMDNYIRLSNKSAIDTFADYLKVDEVVEAPSEEVGITMDTGQPAQEKDEIDKKENKNIDGIEQIEAKETKKVGDSTEKK
ncbi:MAG: hypothetical protein SVZ03_11035 [Spirochaetota bacterium]|nr:hypothetical protein [Spirochaetota bacterium]